MANLSTIKNWFKTGLKPTQQQFWDTWDSFWHKDENIPVANIEGIDNLLNQKANKSVVDAHFTDSNAHAEKFSTKEDKSKKGQADGYAPLDGFIKISADYLRIVDNLVAGGTDKILSAQQGVELQSQINQINVLLQSNDVNLDNVQELVDAIKTVQTSLSTILVNDLTTGGITKALTAEMGKLLQESKVDKITGKGLSTEDFTTEEKQKLAGLDGLNRSIPDATGDPQYTKQVVAKPDGTLGLNDKFEQKIYTLPTPFANNPVYIIKTGKIVSFHFYLHIDAQEYIDTVGDDMGFLLLNLPPELAQNINPDGFIVRNNDIVGSHDTIGISGVSSNGMVFVYKSDPIVIGSWVDLQFTATYSIN
jgi:hypothetical protein